jgi:hypothetical protein
VNHIRRLVPTSRGLLVVLTLASIGTAPQAQETPGGWRTFHGGWSAIGRRYTLPTESSRPAGVVQLSGSVLLTEGAARTTAFQGEVIAFDDASGVGAGRAVWTDSRGDRVFSILRGESIQTGRRIAATITGGTGRYAGATGDYALTWQYVITAEDIVQGRTTDLTGRLRVEGRP